MVGGKEIIGDTTASTIPMVSWTEAVWPTMIWPINTLLGNLGNYSFKKSIGACSPSQCWGNVWQSLSWGEETHLLITPDREPTVDQITDNSKLQLGLNLLQEAVLFSESCVSIYLSESYLKLGSVYSGRAREAQEILEAPLFSYLWISPAE